METPSQPQPPFGDCEPTWSKDWRRPNDKGATEDVDGGSTDNSAAGESADAGEFDLALAAREQHVFGEALLLLGLAIQDRRRAIRVVRAHFLGEEMLALSTEVQVWGSDNEVAASFRRYVLNCLRAIWTSQRSNRALSDDEQLDAIGVTFPFTDLSADVQSTSGESGASLQQAANDVLMSVSGSGTAVVGALVVDKADGRPSAEADSTNVILPAESVISTAVSSQEWTDRPRRHFQSDIELPFRPLRTRANLDGPNARVASSGDLKRYLFSAPSAGGTRLFGVMPILEAKPEKRDAMQTFVVKSPSVMTLDEEIRSRHVLIVGPTGCGKTTKVISSILRSDVAQVDKSVIVLDSKGGELLPLIYELNNEYRPGRKVWVVDFRQPTRSDGWDPLASLDSFSKVRAFAHRMCYAVETRPHSSDSEFWILASIKCLAGILWALKSDSSESCTMARAQQIVEMSIADIKRWASKYPRISGLQSFLEFLDSGSHNAHTVLTDLQNRLAMWSDDDICCVTSTAEVDLSRILSEPSILVVRVNESDASCLRPLTNALFTELVTQLFKRAEESPGGKLPVRVSLVVEEFASAVGRIPEFSRFINVVRSRGLSVVVSVQSLSQIEFEYGAECEPVLAGFCTKVFFPGMSSKDAEFASSLFGNMTVDHREKSVFRDEFASYSSDVGQSEAVKIVKRPIFTPHEIRSPIRHPELGGAVTFDLPETPPFQAFLTPAYELEKLSQFLAATTDRDKLGALRPQEAGVLGPGRSSEPQNLASVAEITDTRGWTQDKLREHLDGVKSKSLDWGNTSGTARKWWEAFEAENSLTLRLVVELAEKLQIRKVTITEFFLAYVHSETNDLEANLFYLDYTRRVREADKKKKEQKEPSKNESEVRDPFDIFAEDPTPRRRRRRNKESPEREAVSAAEAPMNAKELTFIRCPSCRSLMPASAHSCKMCGGTLDASDTP